MLSQQGHQGVFSWPLFFWHDTLLTESILYCVRKGRPIFQHHLCALEPSWSQSRLPGGLLH